VIERRCAAELDLVLKEMPAELSRRHLSLD
jgi:hypothetical protein